MTMTRGRWWWCRWRYCKLIMNWTECKEYKRSRDKYTVKCWTTRCESSISEAYQRGKKDGSIIASSCVQAQSSNLLIIYVKLCVRVYVYYIKKWKGNQIELLAIGCTMKRFMKRMKRATKNHPHHIWTHENSPFLSEYYCFFHGALFMINVKNDHNPKHLAANKYTTNRNDNSHLFFLEERRNCFLYFKIRILLLIDRHRLNWIDTCICNKFLRTNILNL